MTYRSMPDAVVEYDSTLDTLRVRWTYPLFAASPLCWEAEMTCDRMIANESSQTLAKAGRDVWLSRANHDAAEDGPDEWIFASVRVEAGAGELVVSPASGLHTPHLAFLARKVPTNVISIAARWLSDDAMIGERKMDRLRRRWQLLSSGLESILSRWRREVGWRCFLCGALLAASCVAVTKDAASAAIIFMIATCVALRSAARLNAKMMDEYDRWRTEAAKVSIAMARVRCESA